MRIDEKTYKAMPAHMQALFRAEPNPARDEVVALFPESNSSATPRNRKPKEDREHWRMGGGQYNDSTEYGDTGSAARFFYCAKTSKKDRGDGNVHPTVKPTDLMRWLCKLVTPPGGLILDPFMGSGSTLKAAELEGFRATGIELDPNYIAIARSRIAGDAPLFAQVSE